MDGIIEIKRKSKFELKIYFDNGENSLFDLGYLSLDILQLIILGEMLEEGQESRLKEMLENKKPYGYFTRDSSLYRKYKDKAVIKELRKGSLELVIAGVGSFGTLLSVLVALRIEKERKDDETITFSINSNDDYLNKILNDYEKGNFGKEPKNFDWLMRHLSIQGYDIKLQSQDAYIIEKITMAYERKIIKTIKKN